MAAERRSGRGVEPRGESRPQRLRLPQAALGRKPAAHSPLPTFHDPLRTLRAPRLGALRLDLERSALEQPPTDRARTFEQLGSRGHAPEVVVLVLPDQRL